MGERPTPDAPHPGKRRSPRAPSWRPHSMQSQLARAHAVGLVTGPHALKPVRTPVSIFGSLGVCIYVPASRHWLISYSPNHLT